ncbi:hypothetical protein ACYOEI_00560 [Singulisphaera rosea]
MKASWPGVLPRQGKGRRDTFEPNGSGGRDGTGKFARVESGRWHLGRRSCPSGPQPRKAFTEVFEGESINDVAVRVYGSPDASKSLWLANQDLVKTQDEILRSGTFLRTP